MRSDPADDRAKQVEHFLSENPNVQVELWFSKIERDVIARGVFTSIRDIKRKLMRPAREASPRTGRASAAGRIRTD